MEGKLKILLLPLILAALLLAATTAPAAPGDPANAPLAFEEAEDEFEEEGELEESECEAAEEELEEGELEKADVEEICAEEKAREKLEKKAGASNDASPAPEECVLRSAHGHASLVSNDDKLKLTIGYTAYESAAAQLKIGNLDTVHRHLGRSGVLRLVEGLHGNNAPKQLAVRIDIASTKNAGCPFRRLVLSPR